MKKVIRNLRAMYEGIDNNLTHERFNKPSKTIKGQAYTIRDLMSAQMAGNMPEVGQNNGFDENYDPTKDPDFDLADAHAISEELKDNFETKRAEKIRLDKEKDEAEKAELKRLKDAEKNQAKNKPDVNKDEDKP